MSSDGTRPSDTILVVDDNAQNRAVLEGNLVASGYAVTCAENGLQALERLQEHAPDLVLLDVLMPDMDGFETCRRMRALPDGLDTPIVFVTALSDLGTHRTAMESGADDFLTKPVNRTELLLRVKSLLRIKRMSRELRSSVELIQSQHDSLLRVQKQKEMLTGLVVHDLKTPLASILANGQFAIREPQVPESAREALDDIVGAADMMHRMVMNLLDISRSEDGTLAPRLTTIDLGDLIAGVCGRMKHRVEDRNIDLDVEVEPMQVHADSDLLCRLLENLLDNCVKYTPAGGSVRLRARVQNDGKVEIRVTDDGPGVPADYREKIFEKYVQLERDVPSHVRSSRGLGLAFCRLAAEAHGGRIWVEQNEPRGSAFCIVLPGSAGEGRRAARRNESR